MNWEIENRNETGFFFPFFGMNVQCSKTQSLFIMDDSRMHFGNNFPSTNRRRAVFDAGNGITVLRLLSCYFNWQRTNRWDDPGRRGRDSAKRNSVAVVIAYTKVLCFKGNDEELAQCSVRHRSVIFCSRSSAASEGGGWGVGRGGKWVESRLQLVRRCYCCDNLNKWQQMPARLRADQFTENIKIGPTQDERLSPKNQH